jgi:hypothetical protein
LHVPLGNPSGTASAISARSTAVANGRWQSTQHYLSPHQQRRSGNGES